MRDALDRAVVMAEHLKPRDWRVLLACAVLTASWSRTEDETSVGQLASLSGLSRARTSESLGRLSAAGVITWTPTRTRGVGGASRVSLIGGEPNLERLNGTDPTNPVEGEVCPF